MLRDLGKESGNGEFKPVLFNDNKMEKLVIPNGTMGARWEDKAKWNLKMDRRRNGRSH